MKLTENERYTIINALLIAANQYRADAIAIRDSSSRIIDVHGECERLATQFDNQAEDVLSLMERLEYDSD